MPRVKAQRAAAWRCYGMADNQNENAIMARAITNAILVRHVRESRCRVFMRAQADHISLVLRRGDIDVAMAQTTASQRTVTQNHTRPRHVGANPGVTGNPAQGTATFSAENGRPKAVRRRGPLAVRLLCA
jgi:hypothetical protein